MNFQCEYPVESLRVLIINSLSPSAKFLAVKILTGEIFGKNQLIDLVLMFFSNENDDQLKATGLKFELEKCAFACTNTIVVSSKLPWFVNDVNIYSCISDAHVFCLLTNFDNPNILDLDDANNDKKLDMLDLTINIANNLQGPLSEEHADKMAQKQDKHKIKQIFPEKKVQKPIFVTDGFISMHILISLSKNLPSDIFFCPTPITDVAKSVLGEHLKVQRKVLNTVLVWAANDEIFHVEFERPLIIEDGVGEPAPCDRETVGKELLVSTNLDHTQFNTSWLKKDLITKTVAIARKNPYGSIYKAASIAKTLQRIWSTRLTNEKLYTNMGVVSDGSLETIQGYPYVLPIEFSGDTWRVNQRFKEDFHLKQEIKRMNKAVKSFRDNLILFCKKMFLESRSSSMISAEEEESLQEITNM